MRVFLPLIIAAVFFFGTDRGSLAQMNGEPCHEQAQIMAEDIRDSVCCCLAVKHMSVPGASDDSMAESGCCASQACGGSNLVKDIAVVVLVSPEVSAGRILSPFLIQPVPLWTLRVHSSGLSPPHWPSAPVYIHNCSFLI